jgi:serine/threonine protein kinase
MQTKSSNMLSNMSHNSSMEAVKALSMEDFRIIKVIGRGSFGKVYLVEKKAKGGSSVENSMEYFGSEAPEENELFAIKELKKSLIYEQNQVANTISERKILEKI